MFDADRPITHTEQDRLNRSQFSKYLARCMLDHKDPESLVVGLYGGPGVGKTSIINLVLEELNTASNNMLDHEKPIILNFSPWSYSGQHELVYSFFRRLSSTLNSAPYLENRARIVYLLELYISFFTHKPISLAPLQEKSFLKKLFGRKKAIHGWESGRDLTLVKTELNDLLRKPKHKIIIFIDNISRLYPDEIKQIFQIVKSIGDYTNTAYLLALDKDQAIHALNSVEKNIGEQLIEKVIQLPFDVPPILAQDLENIFADRLNEVVRTTPDDTWNTQQWADVYYTSLKYFFKNCRDITRYVNTLSFSYNRLRDIVNPVDFFALTAIEVFSPEVYFGIRDNKDLFSDLLDNVYVLDQEQIKKDKLRCDEILSRNTRINSVVLLDLILLLFPRIRRIYEPNITFYHSDILARKLKRACNPDFFDAYFRLSMQSGQILQSEFDTLPSLANKISVFDQAITRLNQDHRITKFLDMLDSTVLDTLPKENISAIVHSLIDNGDLFPQGTAGRLSLETSSRIHRILHRALHRFSAEERLSIMREAISNASKSIYTIVRELREQAREHLEDDDTYVPMELRDFTAEQLNTLRQSTVKRIEYWAEHQSLEEHPKMLPILLAWHEWGKSHGAERYVETMVESDRGLLALLTAALSDPIKQAMTKYQRNPDWEKYIGNINVFVDPQKLIPHAKLLFEDDCFKKLRESEQLALMIFLDLVGVNA